MKSLKSIFYLSFFFVTVSLGQVEQASTEYAFAVKNGISNHLFFGSDGEDYDLAYVNGLRIQLAFASSEKYSSILGLQYGKSASARNWVCGTNWDYCEMHGVPPIEVRSIERRHYISLFYNAKFTFLSSFISREDFQ